jgi:hypothetical protein
MGAAVTAGAGHPAVAVLLGLGTVVLACAVVAMAWHVHTSQIRLAEQLARRQFLTVKEADAPGHAVNGNSSPAVPVKEARGAKEAVAAGARAPVVIEGPETVVTGGPARYRVQPSGRQQVVSWAVGGGSVTQAPDPSHPEELLLVADRPGNLMISVRVREGMTERRGTKAVTAAVDMTEVTPPFTLRVFLHAWGLILVAVLVIGFAGALSALGNFTPSDFIMLASPLAALIGVVAVARGAGDAGSRGNGKGSTWPSL